MRRPLLPLLLAAVALSGCASVTKQRVAGAAKTAISHPLTWGGAGAAALFGLRDFDRKASDWAKENTPVFGSRADAADASDRLRRYADYGAIASAVLVAEPWYAAPGVVVIEAASTSLTRNTTGVIKREVGRARPHGRSFDSFPSAHSSTAFNYATLGSRGAHDLGLPGWAATTISGGFYTLATGTAWARVEAGVHYPSDVLFGAALGNFFAIFIYDGFIHGTLTTTETAPISFAPLEEGGGVMQLSLRY